MTATPAILLVDDDAPFRTVLGSELGRLGFGVDMAASGLEALRHAAASDPDVVLLDLRLPDIDGLAVLKALKERESASEVILLTGHGSIDSAIEAIRDGAFDYVAKPCSLSELEIRINRALERRSLTRQAKILERGLTPPDVGNAFIGESAEFRRVIELIDRAAPSRSTVLITGETGTGKEMAAKLIHARSPRRDRPFVVVECAALQESLLQSELFGHERGAFTGADRAKAGLFEVANAGTIFLDEIGEVSQATQVKLLRVLDTATFRHVGGTREIKVDVRVLAATNRDLPAMVRSGLFREDLYYRLGTILLNLPPLRARRQDITLLANYFVQVLNDRFGVRRQLSGAALDMLAASDWPGNVRELMHAVEAAIVVADDDEIRPEHLGTAHNRARVVGVAEPATLSTLVDLERAHIVHVLRRTNGHRANAARVLGISERNLYRKIHEYSLD